MGSDNVLNVPVGTKMWCSVCKPGLDLQPDWIFIYGDSGIFK